MRNVDKTSVGKSETKRPYGIHRRRWKYNVKVEFKDIGSDYVDHDSSI
jgi:hypothetical protein